MAKVTKKNVGPPEREFFLKREENGVLRLAKLVGAKVSQDGLVLDKVKASIIQHEREGQRYTPDSFARSFAGAFYGYGKDRLRRVVNSALLEGTLVQKFSKGPSGHTAGYLSVPES